MYAVRIHVMQEFLPRASAVPSSLVDLVNMACMADIFGYAHVASQIDDVPECSSDKHTNLPEPSTLPTFHTPKSSGAQQTHCMGAGAKAALHNVNACGNSGSCAASEAAGECNERVDENSFEVWGRTHPCTRQEDEGSWFLPTT